jgi:hypothetical protein
MPNKVFHLQHVDAYANPNITTAIGSNITTAIGNDTSRCGLVCGAADALKESVAAHSAAASASASSDFEDILFGEGAERWLHMSAPSHLHIPQHSNRVANPKPLRIHFLSSCAADDCQPQSYWYVSRAHTPHTIITPHLTPANRYHAFDKLYEILLTELHDDAGASGHEIKHGLHGFIREAVVCR